MSPIPETVLDFLRAKARYAARWFESRGWRTVLDAEELFHEALIYALRAAEDYGERCSENLLKAAGHHRIIDVTEKERRLQARSTRSDGDELHQFVPARQPRTPLEQREDQERVYELVGVLDASLQGRKREIVMEFIFPSERTCELMGDFEAPRVVHVAKALGVNKGTVSLALREARELLIEAGVEVKPIKRVTRRKSRRAQRGRAGAL